MATWTYSPENLQILVGGFYSVVGFVDGTFLNIRKNVSPFTTVRTTDGKLARTFRKDRSYSIDLTLMLASTSNDVLTKIWQVDEFTKNGFFPLLIKDTSGSTLFFSSSAWIENIPEVTFSNSIESRVWPIQCADGYINVGSNDNESSLVEDLANLVASASPIIQGILQ